eukprot:g13274.t1
MDTGRGMDTGQAVDTDRGMDTVQDTDTGRGMDTGQAVDTGRGMDTGQAMDTGRATDMDTTRVGMVPAMDSTMVAVTVIMGTGTGTGTKVVTTAVAGSMGMVEEEGMGTGMEAAGAGAAGASGYLRQPFDRDPSDNAPGQVNRCLDLTNYDEVESPCRPHLGRMTLSSCGITDDDLQDLANCFDINGRQNIHSLDLSGNELTSLPGETFDSFTELEYLDLSGNELTSLPSEVFDPLAKLEHLDIYDNGLTDLPAGIFGKLPELDHLSLAQNRLTTLPDGLFGQLDKLRTLPLFSNDLVELPAGVFDSLSNVWLMLLDDNQLTSLPPGTFDELTSLQHLDMSNNDLRTLPSGIFVSLSAMDTLYLEANPQLGCLPDLPGLTTTTPSISWSGDLSVDDTVGTMCECDLPDDTDPCDQDDLHCAPGENGYTCATMKVLSTAATITACASCASAFMMTPASISRVIPSSPLRMMSDAAASAPEPAAAVAASEPAAAAAAKPDAAAAAAEPVEEESAAAPPLPKREMSASIPFLRKPPNLDGMVGDIGFDPFEFADIFPVKYLREAELKHGRVAMLAVVGWLVSEVVHIPGAAYQSENPVDAMAAVGPVPMFQIFAFCGWLEYTFHNGKLNMDNMHEDGNAPGDFGFDPIGLGSKPAAVLERYQLQELKHGRLAMSAIGGLVHQSILLHGGVPFHA